MDLQLIGANSWTDEIKEGWLMSVGQHTARVANSAAAKQWMAFIDPVKVYEYPFTNPYNAIFVDGYVILFEIGTPWYGNAVFLNELLVTRVGPSQHGYASVIATLDKLAADFDVDAIAVGDAFTLDRRLQRVYGRAGFRPEATTLVKRRK